MHIHPRKLAWVGLLCLGWIGPTRATEARDWMRLPVDRREEGGQVEDPSGWQVGLRFQHETLDFQVFGPGSLEPEFTLTGVSKEGFFPRLPELRRGNPRPDAFDAYLLRMAEFSRSGLVLPRWGTPWVPSGIRTSWPIRSAALTNNCLQAGLWEFSTQPEPATTDSKPGRATHLWFRVPLEPYLREIARREGVPFEFVKAAVAWSEAPASFQGSRLRRVVQAYPKLPVSRAPRACLSTKNAEEVRKIESGYLFGAPPLGACQALEKPLEFRSFDPPGIYDTPASKTFDLAFLAQPRSVQLRKIAPSTAPRQGPAQTLGELTGCYELELEFQGQGRKLALLLGPLEPETLAGEGGDLDFSFGYGVPDPKHPRFQMVAGKGPGRAPLYAFLLDRGSPEAESPGAPLEALNHHHLGLERVRLRVDPNSKGKFGLEIVSFERMVTLVELDLFLGAGTEANASLGRGPGTGE